MNLRSLRGEYETQLRNFSRNFSPKFCLAPYFFATRTQLSLALDVSHGEPAS
ncbi:MAG: hypothetical protein MUF72_06710 [Elainella sp. Prado103]|nr:hypothetical protein [Elainella sp. Prado103]